MSNFGSLFVTIYTQALASIDYYHAISGKGTAHLNRVGDGECTIKVQDTNTTMASIVRGNIAVCYVHDAIAGKFLAVSAFTIEEIHRKTLADGMSEVRFAGRDLLGELTGYLHFTDIGDSYSTTLAAAEIVGNKGINVADIGATKTYIDNYQPPGGSLHVDVNDASSFAAGDSIILQQDDDDDGGHLATITNIAANAIAFTNDALPGQMSSFGEVYIPEVWDGDTIKVALGDPTPDGTYHYSRLDQVPRAGINSGATCEVHIADGLTAAAASGNSVLVIAPSSPTTDDIHDIMAPAVDAASNNWTLDSSAAGTPVGGGDLGGTEFGTGHSVDGANIIELLINTNELTTEWFRLEHTDADKPYRTLAWRKTSDATGITLEMEDTAGIAASYASTTKGVIRDLTAETRWKIATAIVPKGGSDLFDLGDATNTPTAGYTKELWNGVWRLVNDTLDADYTYTHYVTFSDVVETTDVDWAITKAANDLLDRAEAYLGANDSAEEFKQGRATIHDDVLPGQSITVGYTEDNWTESMLAYIVEVSHMVGADGVRYTDLLLSETSPYNRITAEERLVTGSSTGGSITSTGGGGGGGGTTHDPVTVLSKPSGMLTVTGQVLSFNLVAGDGLASASTVLSVDTSTNSGLQITSGELELDLSSSSGLQLTSNELELDISANSGLQITSNELEMDVAADSGLQLTSNELELGTPTTVTTSSTNDVSGAGHSHAATTTADAMGTPSTILQGDADGRLELSGLNLGEVTATSDHLVLDSLVDAKGEGYNPAGGSGFTIEWMIDTRNTEGEGTLYISNVVADSLIVQMFQAEMTIATTSGLLVTKSVGVVHETFQVPAIAGNVAIIIKDNPVVGTAGVFEDNDKVVFRAFERDSGLTVGWVGGYVTSYSDNGDGTQDWTFYREDTTAGLATLDIQMGSVIINYGVTGQGWWEVDGSRDTGPMTRIGTWAGANPWDAGNRTTHIMTGNLNSITSQGDYGFYAAVGSPAGPRLVISDREASFHQIPISLYSGTSDGGNITLRAIELNSDVETAIAPNSDVSDDNIVKAGTVHATYYEYIDDDPSVGQPDADYLYNTVGESASLRVNLDDISHTITTLSLEAYIGINNFVDDTCQLRAQVFKNDAVSELTDEVKVCSESTANGLVTVEFTGVDTTASDADWAGARLLLTWVYHVGGGDEVIKLEPNMEVGPYIAVGGTLPTDYDTTGIGFWVGKDPDDDAYKMRIGEAGGAALLWDGTTGAEELIIRDGDGNDVITFQEDGDSFFSGVMNIATAGEIQQGTGTWGVDFAGIRIFNDSGVGTVAGYSGDTKYATLDDDGFSCHVDPTFRDPSSYTFKNASGTVISGLYSRQETVTQHVTKLEVLEAANRDVGIEINALGAAGKDAYIYLVAQADSEDVPNAGITINNLDTGVSSIDISADYTNVSDGFCVGDLNATPDTGQLILDQGAGDGHIIRLISSDIAHGVTTLAPTDVYGYMAKLGSTTGGVQITGLSEGTQAFYVKGVATTTDVTEATSSGGTIMLETYKVSGTGVTSFGSDDNIVVMRNNAAAQWILKGNGDVYINGAQNTYDSYDDIAMIRAASLLSPNAVRTQYDSFVQYNRNDLETAGLVSGAFVNTTGMMRLHSGALWQLHQRIAQLEAQIGKAN